MSVELRSYQQIAVNQLRRRLMEKKRKLILAAPTGSGKTVIAAFILASSLSRKKKVLFIAHRRELINQAFNKLKDAGIEDDRIGIIMARDKRTRQAPVQVASIDTLRRRQLPEADLVIIDEAHRSLAASYIRVINHYVELGATVLGMTATPYRGDGKPLGDIYEALEVVSTPRKLIELGFLVEPRVFSVPQDSMPNMSGVRVRHGDYLESDLEEAVNQRKLVGNIVDHWLQRANGTRTVAFAVSVAHSKHICQEFVSRGIPAEHLDGETPVQDRDAILARLEAGTTLVVCNCGVLCEGWDQPAVKCAILARPTKSLVLYLQQGGRILRPWNGVGAIILDHAGNARAHGLPQDDRELSLEAKVSSSGDRPKKCPRCNAVIDATLRECPECGYDFQPNRPKPQDTPPIQGEGSLVEIDPTRLGQMKSVWDGIVKTWQRINTRRERHNEATLKQGWIYHRFREVFGCRPPTYFVAPYERATDAGKRLAHEELKKKAMELKFKPGWADNRFRDRFGHFPGSIGA